jgi:hypothetical protein
MHGLIREEIVFGPNVTAKALAQHLYTRIHFGAVAIIADNPSAVLPALRKQWLKLIRQAQKQKSSTLNASKIAQISDQILRMQAVNFSANYIPELCPQPDVVIATSQQFLEWAPECQTLYVTCDIEREYLYQITAWMQKGALMVVRKVECNGD